MTAASDFQRAIRGGRRYGTRTVVAHFWCCEAVEQDPRIGLAVSKSVGNSVVRHRVSRQLRHVCRPQVELLPAGSMLVLRATSAAATASSAELALDVERAVSALRSRR